MTKFKWRLLFPLELGAERLQGTVFCEICNVWQVTALTSWGLSSLCHGQSSESHWDVTQFSLISSHLQIYFSFFCKKIQIAFISLQCEGCPSDNIDVQRSHIVDLSRRWKFLKDKAAVCLSPCRRSIAQVTPVTASKTYKGTLGSSWGFEAVGTTENGNKVCYKGYLCLFDMYLLFDNPISSSNCSKNTRWKTRVI